MEPQGKKRICILYVEDNPNDFLLVKRLLGQLMKEEGVEEEFDIELVDRVSQGLDRLDKGGVDIVLSDLNLPDALELEAIISLRSHFPMVPIIALTNAYAQSLGVEAVRKGAQDYLLKDELNAHIFRQSILYAIERKRLEKIKDEFVSSISHELKTPLSVLKGGGGVLKMGSLGPITPQQEEVLSMMTRNVDRLTRILNNILDLSRLESGHFKINRRAINLKPLIHEFISDFSKGEVNGKILVEENIPNLPEVFADPNLIIEVLSNLLNNALRYAKTKITITAQLADRAICVSVIDDGPVFLRRIR